MTDKTRITADDARRMMAEGSPEEWLDVIDKGIKEAASRGGTRFWLYRDDLLGVDPLFAAETLHKVLNHYRGQGFRVEAGQGGSIVAWFTWEKD